MRTKEKKKKSRNRSRVVVLFPPKEKALLAKLSAKQKLSVGAFARKAILASMKRAA